MSVVVVEVNTEQRKFCQRNNEFCQRNDKFCQRNDSEFSAKNKNKKFLQRKLLLNHCIKLDTAILHSVIMVMFIDQVFVNFSMAAIRTAAIFASCIVSNKHGSRIDVNAFV